VTSGTQSPTLDRVVAMGYVLSELAGVGSPLQIDIRGRLADAEVVSLPFYTRDVGT
jgi:aminomethyltransferase